MAEERPVTHYCKGPGIWDTACDIKGNYMTLLVKFVTCPDCLQELRNRSGDAKD